VPSGWHHTVRNLEDTLSINHNWLNGFNLHWAWALLRRERAEAAAAIEDCRCGILGRRGTLHVSPKVHSFLPCWVVASPCAHQGQMYVSSLTGDILQLSIPSVC
jgi:hypothetical protein